MICKVENCTRGVKVRGYCWGHGGGKRQYKLQKQAQAAARKAAAVRVAADTREPSSSTARSGGLSLSDSSSSSMGTADADRSHPSQSTLRCIFDGCGLPVSVVNSFCEAHSREVMQPGYVFEL